MLDNSELFFLAGAQYVLAMLPRDILRALYEEFKIHTEVNRDTMEPDVLHLRKTLLDSMEMELQNRDQESY